MGASLLLSLVVVGPVAATHVAPVLVDGNPFCADEGGSGPDLGFDHGLKIDPPAEGTFNVGAGTVTISDIDTSVNPATFTWTSSGVVVAAISVKGTSAANVYYYNPPPTTTDDGLHAPGGFSHINICWNEPPPTGSLKITKALTGGPGGFSGDFDVHIDCGQTGGTFDRTITYPTPGFVTIDGIAAGAECTVTETGVPTAPLNFEWDDETITGSPATIVKDGTAEVTVTNHLVQLVGDLTITKVVSGAPGGFSGDFDVHVDCGSGGTFDRTISWPTPGFVTILDIPAGSQCAVTETDVPDAPGGLQWAAVQISGSPAAIVADSTANVTVTNTLVEIVQQGNPVLTILKTNNAPLLGGLPVVEEGDTVTYALGYALVDGPVDLGVITDVLPVGVTYKVGTATNSGNNEFIFQGYDSATRTLTWTAVEVTSGGIITYQATIDVGAPELTQPLTNTATIDSEDTEPDSDTSDVNAFEPPQVETHLVTGPPTDVIAKGESAASGSTMVLVLLMLVGVVGGILAFAPVPASIRRRKR